MHKHIWFLMSLLIILVGCDSAEVSDPVEEDRISFRATLFELVSGERVEAEEGELVVPERWDSDAGSMIRLKVLRFKSTSAEPGPPIVYLAGGPGDSGIENMRYMYEGLFRHLLGIADVITLDQRGTGQSDPSLFCDQSVELSPVALANRSALIAAFEQPSLECAAYWSSQGVDLTAYNTIESAGDIDALRRALEVEKVSLVGLSYGTHLALSFAKQYPGTIHRMVLAGIEGPDQALKRPSTLESQYRLMSESAAIDPELSRIIPDVYQATVEVLDELKNQPKTVSVNHPMTGEPTEVVFTDFLARFLIGQQMGFARDVQTVPAMIFAMREGAYSDLARAVLGFERIPMPSAMTFMMDCSSGASAERLGSIQAETESSLLGDVLNLPFPDICSAWGSPSLGSDFHQPVRSDVPTLLISGTLDGRTPPGNAEDVLTGLSSGIHLIIENGGHDTLDDWFNIPNYRSAVVTFMQEQPLPETHITLPFEFEIP